MKQFWSAYLGSKELEWPLPHAKITQLPPVLVQTAEYDILRDEGRSFAEAIQKAGKEIEYRSYKDTAHGILQMPSIVSKRSAVLHDIAEIHKTQSRMTLASPASKSGRLLLQRFSPTLWAIMLICQLASSSS